MTPSDQIDLWKKEYSAKGYEDATREAFNEIAENYRPNDR